MKKATQAELMRLPPDLRKAVEKSTAKMKKTEKWRGRAAGKGQQWDSMSKQERRVFKAVYRADRTLQKLSTIIAAREAKGGAPLGKAAGGAGSAPLSDTDIRAITTARARRNL
jgi:hypothetical protein